MNNNRLNDISISDKKEQLRLILLDIDIKNKELSDILSNILSNNKVFEENSILLKNQKTILNKLVRDISEKENKVVKLDKIILDKTNKINNLNIKFDNLSLKIDKTKFSFNENISIYNNTIENLKEEKKLINIEIKKLLDSIDDKNIYIEKKDLKIKKKQEEYNILKQEVSELIKVKDNFIINFNKEKDILNKQIEDAKSSILRPMELLSESNYEVDRKKKNLDILLNRFRKEFKKIYPNQEPKI